MADLDHDIARIAREVFGWDELRPGIAEPVRAVVDGRDALAVMPTGYGKSGIYEIAGTLLDGPTLVVSPLIALQADQVARLAEHDRRAAMVNSGQGARATRAAWHEFAEGGPVFLFLAPEQLADDAVLDRLREASVRLMVVDEAQCVSLWGDDFRPDYANLHEHAEAIGRPPILALTATGSPPVRDDIVDRLGLRDPLIVAHGFDRPNLRLEVVRHESDKEKREAVIEQVAGLPRPGLLYVSTRRKTGRYARALVERGLTARAYHGAMPTRERREVHEAFSAGEADVVVATSAFGMGIDKADVRFVVHADVPASPDDYYQEIGRAGRDGEPALATLHYRPEDFAIARFFNGGTPDRDQLANLFGAVRDDRAASRSALARSLGASARTVERQLRLFEEAGVLTSGTRRLDATDVDPGDAADQAVEAALRRQRVDASRLEMMRGYAETLGCRRQVLLAYFGEEYPRPCGNCDTCSSGSAAEHEAPAGAPAGPYRLHADVTHAQWGHGVVMHTDADRITVYFDQEGYKVLSLDVIEETGVLSSDTGN